VRKLRSLEGPDEILVGDLILLEVLRGARDEAHAARLERELRRFNIEPMLDDRLAVRAAANYRELRRRGLTVRKTVDVIIGTFCLEYGHALLHDDRDFDPFVKHLGMRVV
jgi:predicted nucleic acid-binding protein